MEFPFFYNGLLGSPPSLWRGRVELDTFDKAFGHSLEVLERGFRQRALRERDCHRNSRVFGVTERGTQVLDHKVGGERGQVGRAEVLVLDVKADDPDPVFDRDGLLSNDVFVSRVRRDLAPLVPDKVEKLCLRSERRKLRKHDHA